MNGVSFYAQTAMRYWKKVKLWHNLWSRLNSTSAAKESAAGETQKEYHKGSACLCVSPWMKKWYHNEWMSERTIASKNTNLFAKLFGRKVRDFAILKLLVRVRYRIAKFTPTNKAFIAYRIPIHLQHSIISRSYVLGWHSLCLSALQPFCSEQKTR